MGTLKVSEIYRSIMGELPYQGSPCVIIRLAGCNLRCLYCDTQYAIDAESYSNREISVDLIVKEITGQGPSIILVTGGEPMCQEETPLLIRELRARDYRVVLETNGVYDLSSLPEEVVKVVDVKCPGSGEVGTYLDSNIEALDSKDRLKFVVMDRNDYHWSVSFLQDHGFEVKARLGLDSGKPGILFSPVHGQLEPEVLVGWILDDGIEAQLNLQIHKIIGLR
jgi:7-carboxy-7-deazaguanine synthase